MAGYKEYLEIKSISGYTDKFNPNKNLELRTFTITEELMGKKNLSAELSLPIYYVNGVETQYPFDKSFYVEYNNDRYYLNTNKPQAIKNNDNNFVVYTLVMESVCSNKLDGTFVKNVGYNYRDTNDDGWADVNEYTEEVQVFAQPAFFGNIYKYIQYIRQNLEYVFGYQTDNSGNVIKINNTYPLPKFAIKFEKISQHNNFWQYQDDEYKDENQINAQGEFDPTIVPKYKISVRENIDLANTTFFGAMQKLNEIFTYRDTNTDSSSYGEDVGYNFVFETLPVPNTDYTIPTIIVDKEGETVKTQQGAVATFEYGGTASQGNNGSWLLDITRNTNDDKHSNRIYATGSGENLPPNYLRIAENTFDEVHKFETYLMPYENREELIEKVESKDNTKTYLVQREDFPDVFDKHIYIADGKLEFAQTYYKANKLNVFTDRSNVIFCRELPEIGTFAYKEVANKIYILRDADDQHEKAYFFNPYYSEGGAEGKWINLGAYTDEEGIEHDDLYWSTDRAGIGMILNLPSNFASRDYFIPNLQGNGNNTNADIFFSNSQISFSHVNYTNFVYTSDHPYLVIALQNNFNTLQELFNKFEHPERKLFYIIKETSNVEGGDKEYVGRFIKLDMQNGFYYTGLTTYERVNPFPKYLSVFSNLMPDIVRAYFAGWRYACLWLSQYTTIGNAEYLEVQRNITHHEQEAHSPFIVVNDIFRKIYLDFPYTIDNEQETYRIFLGLFDTTLNDEDYKDINQSFMRGVTDFIKCDKTEYIGKEYGFDIYQLPQEETIEYKELGKTWKPTTYLDAENIDTDNIIESTETFDVKTSFVNCWVDNLGRLDEIVDVYIPNAFDEENIGKYWLDEHFYDMTINSLNGDLGNGERISIEMYQNQKIMLVGLNSGTTYSGTYIEHILPNGAGTLTYFINTSFGQARTIKAGGAVLALANVSVMKKWENGQLVNYTVQPDVASNRLSGNLKLDIYNTYLQTYGEIAPIKIKNGDVLSLNLDEDLEINNLWLNGVNQPSVIIPKGHKCKIYFATNNNFVVNAGAKIYDAVLGANIQGSKTKKIPCLPIPENERETSIETTNLTHNTPYVSKDIDITELHTNVYVDDYEQKTMCISNNIDIELSNVTEVGKYSIKFAAMNKLIDNNNQVIDTKQLTSTFEFNQYIRFTNTQNENDTYECTEFSSALPYYLKNWLEITGSNIGQNHYYKSKFLDGKYLNTTYASFVVLYYNTNDKLIHFEAKHYSEIDNPTYTDLDLDDYPTLKAFKTNEYTNKVQGKTFNMSFFNDLDNAKRSLSHDYLLTKKENLVTAKIMYVSSITKTKKDIMRQEAQKQYKIHISQKFSVTEPSFDYTTRQFFIWVKDIHFNPMLPAFQGDNAPDVVFSTGQVAGLDCKFVISTTHCDGVVEDTTHTLNTQLKEFEVGSGLVHSKYMIALQMIEHQSEEQEKSLFRFLPAGYVAPQPKDLFIFENVIYPHNPYVYKAEMDLRKKMRLALKESKRYSYAITLDHIAIEQLGIDFNQIKIGNKIKVKNATILGSNNTEFVIKSVTITRDSDSIYDKYQVVLDNEFRITR